MFSVLEGKREQLVISPDQKSSLGAQTFPPWDPSLLAGGPGHPCEVVGKGAVPPCGSSCGKAWAAGSHGSHAQIHLPALGCLPQGWQVTQLPAQLGLSSHTWFGHQSEAQLSRPPPSRLTPAGNSSLVPLQRAWGAAGWWCQGHARTAHQSAGHRTVGRNGHGDPGDTARCPFSVLLPKSECPPVLTPTPLTGAGCCRAVPHPWPPPAPPSRQVPQLAGALSPS